MRKCTCLDPAQTTTLWPKEWGHACLFPQMGELPGPRRGAGGCCAARPSLPRWWTGCPRGAAARHPSHTPPHPLNTRSRHVLNRSPTKVRWRTYLLQTQHTEPKNHAFTFAQEDHLVDDIVRPNSPFSNSPLPFRSSLHSSDASTTSKLFDFISHPVGGCDNTCAGRAQARRQRCLTRLRSGAGTASPRSGGPP